MTATMSGHANGHTKPAATDRNRDAFSLGWNHARSVLRAQFGTAMESARRMKLTGPEPEFHAGLLAGLEQATASLDTAPVESDRFVLVLEPDDHEERDWQAVVVCPTQEQARQWASFLNTLPLGDAHPYILTVRHDAPVPNLARTERIFTARVLRDDKTGKLTCTMISEVERVGPEHLWFSVQEQYGAFYVRGIFATNPAAAESIAVQSVNAWLASQPDESAAKK